MEHKCARRNGGRVRKLCSTQGGEMRPSFQVQELSRSVKVSRLGETGILESWKFLNEYQLFLLLLLLFLLLLLVATAQSTRAWGVLRRRRHRIVSREHSCFFNQERWGEALPLLDFTSYIPRDRLWFHNLCTNWALEASALHKELQVTEECWEQVR